MFVISTIQTILKVQQRLNLLSDETISIWPLAGLCFANNPDFCRTAGSL